MDKLSADNDTTVKRQHQILLILTTEACMDVLQQLPSWNSDRTTVPMRKGTLSVIGKQVFLSDGPAARSRSLQTYKIQPVIDDLPTCPIAPPQCRACRMEFGPFTAQFEILTQGRGHHWHLLTVQPQAFTDLSCHGISFSRWST